MSLCCETHCRSNFCNWFSGLGPFSKTPPPACPSLGPCGTRILWTSWQVTKQNCSASLLESIRKARCMLFSLSSCRRARSQKLERWENQLQFMQYALTHRALSALRASFAKPACQKNQMQHALISNRRWWCSWCSTVGGGLLAVCGAMVVHLAPACGICESHVGGHAACWKWLW